MNNLNLDLIEILEFSNKQFEEQGISSEVDLEDIIDYFKKRFLIILNDMGFKGEEVQSVLFKNKFNPLQSYEELKVLKKFI